MASGAKARPRNVGASDKRSPAARHAGTPASKGKLVSVVTAAPPGERLLRIGGAAKLVGVEPYVLRFWETQFPFVRPKQSRSRHRHYSPTDIDSLKIVKRLLHIEGYTIAGARKLIRESGLNNLQGSARPPDKSGRAKATDHRLTAAFGGISLKHNLESIHSRTNHKLNRALRQIREDLRSVHKCLTEQIS